MNTLYLIDLENVQSAGLEGVELLTEDDYVLVFYSNKADNLKIDLVKKIKDSPAEVDYIKADNGTPNALDFQLITYLFCHLHAADQFWIVSKDTGYDASIKMCRRLDVKNVRRAPAIKNALHFGIRAERSAALKAAKAEAETPQSAESNELSTSANAAPEEAADEDTRLSFAESRGSGQQNPAPESAENEEYAAAFQSSGTALSYEDTAASVSVGTGEENAPAVTSPMNSESPADAAQESDFSSPSAAEQASGERDNERTPALGDTQNGMTESETERIRTSDAPADSARDTSAETAKGEEDIRTEEKTPQQDALPFGNGQEAAANASTHCFPEETVLPVMPVPVRFPEESPADKADAAPEAAAVPADETDAAPKTAAVPADKMDAAPGTAAEGTGSESSEKAEETTPRSRSGGKNSVNEADPERIAKLKTFLKEECALDADAHELALLSEGLDRCENKNQFYHFFRRRMGAAHGSAFYKSIRSQLVPLQKLAEEE